MKRTIWGALVLAMAAGGCKGGDVQEGTTTGGEGVAGAGAEPAGVAIAELESAPSGAAVEGTVTFTEQEGGGVLVEADVTGLSAGAHGFHIHEQGECEPPGFESAGGHFASEGEQHGAPDEPGHHLGDLGNIEVGPSGAVHYSIRADDLTLGGGENSIIGKAVIIHAERDDYETQPTGASGERVACGVIEPSS